MKRLESPPSGHFMTVARVPVAPPTIRRHTVSKTKPVLQISAFIGDNKTPSKIFDPGPVFCGIDDVR